MELWYNPQEITSRFKELNPSVDFTASPYYCESMARSQVKWRKNNKRKVNSYHKVSRHKRRATIKEARGSFANQELAERWQLFDYRCVYCGSKRKKLTIDHWIPLSRGGTNYIENIVPACVGCNLRKHVRRGDEFQFGAVVQMRFAIQAQRVLNSPSHLARQHISV